MTEKARLLAALSLIQSATESTLQAAQLAPDRYVQQLDDISTHLGAIYIVLKTSYKNTQKEAETPPAPLLP